jgi:D-sedoheptulose 7-phosphate isomerase
MKHLIQKQLAQSIATMQATLADLHIADTLATVSELTANAMLAGRKLMIAGNGGSASDAQHIAAEFVVRFIDNRPALPAIALTTDTSILTAGGNDFGFEQVFARQIEALGKAGDVFLAISTSGNSPNVLRAIEQARSMNIAVVGLTGQGGGKMRDLCDHSIVIPSKITMHIQECHLALEHILCLTVEQLVMAEKKPRHAVESHA